MFPLDVYHSVMWGPGDGDPTARSLSITGPSARARTMAIVGWLVV